MYALHPSATAEAVHTWPLIDDKMPRASWSEEVMVNSSNQEVYAHIVIV